MDETSTLLQYYEQRHCNKQWKFFLLSLAEEFTSSFDQLQSQHVIHNVGKRLATLLPLPPLETLEDMEQAINRVWETIDWGWVSLDASQNHLSIKHFAAPLDSAFSESHRAWSAALLAGVYDKWFELAGANEGLSVRHNASTPLTPGSFEFVLAEKADS